MAIAPLYYIQLRMSITYVCRLVEDVVVLVTGGLLKLKNPVQQRQSTRRKK